MKNLILISFSLLLLLSLGSCGGGDVYKNEVASLDSLLKALEHEEKIFLQLDSAEVIRAMEVVNSKLGKAGELITDTMSKEEALLLSNFRSVKKPFKEFNQKYSGTKREISITKKQLTDLIHDLSKGIMKKTDAELNFNKEKSLATMLIKSLQLTTETIPIYLKKYNTLNPRIDSLVQVKEQLLLPKTGK